MASAMASANASASASANASVANDCAICCDKFNMSTHARIICEYGDCNYGDACKACVRTYLLNTASDPHCMNCKKAWSQKFLVENLNKSYVSTDFKKHKKQFLLDREISKLPETMDAAEKFALIETEENKVKAFTVEMTELKILMASLYEKINNCRNKIFHIKTDSKDKPEERKTFIMPCPNNDCRGYLSTQYKCQLCNLHTCSKCHEIIGHSKEDEHNCKEENVQTAELIKKETKGCPCCGTRIFKISGCDQMWCVTCHKAFSWKTGKIETGVVHNPHFYEYQRKTNGGVAPRNPGDVQCGRLCSWYDMNRFTSKLPLTLKKHLQNIHRCFAHMIEQDMRIMRRKITDLSNHEQIRIDYIIKRISKDEMATKIYRNNGLRKKYTEMINIYDLITVVGIEFFQSMIDSTLTGVAYNKMLEDKLSELDKLRIYCNEQFAIISNTYSQTVPQMDETFAITSKKMTIKKKKSVSGKDKAASADDDLQSDTMSQFDVTELEEGNQVSP